MSTPIQLREPLQNIIDEFKSVDHNHENAQDQYEHIAENVALLIASSVDAFDQDNREQDMMEFKAELSSLLVILAQKFEYGPVIGLVIPSVINRLLDQVAQIEITADRVDFIAKRITSLGESLTKIGNTLDSYAKEE